MVGDFDQFVSQGDTELSKSAKYPKYYNEQKKSFTVCSSFFRRITVLHGKIVGRYVREHIGICKVISMRRTARLISEGKEIEYDVNMPLDMLISQSMIG